MNDLITKLFALIDTITEHLEARPEVLETAGLVFEHLGQERIATVCRDRAATYRARHLWEGIFEVFSSRPRRRQRAAVVETAPILATPADEPSAAALH